MSTSQMDLQHAADSTTAKVSARILMPIMIGVLTLLVSMLGWLMVRFVNTFDAAQLELRQAQGAVGIQVNQIDKKVDLMTQRVDQMLIRQVDQNTGSIKEHSQRLDRIERAVKLPGVAV
jgi:hypothetical protein